MKDINEIRNAAITEALKKRSDAVHAAEVQFCDEIAKANAAYDAEHDRRVAVMNGGDAAVGRGGPPEVVDEFADQLRKIYGSDALSSVDKAAEEAIARELSLQPFPAVVGGQAQGAAHG